MPPKRRSRSAVSLASRLVVRSGWAVVLDMVEGSFKAGRTQGDNAEAFAARILPDRAHPHSRVDPAARITANGVARISMPRGGP
jgi:hypothetical protein